MREVEIIIPIYKATPTAREAFALDHTINKLKAYRYFFIAPVELDITHYAKRYGGSFKFYPAKYFASIRGYNKLLLSIEFYEDFSDVEFLLIIQPDALILRDDLPKWLIRPFDFVGAPWPDGFEFRLQVGKFAAGGGKIVKVFVGNGGFSLRRRSKCIALLREYPDVAEWFVHSGSSEDLFFSILGALSLDFILPNQMMASEFAVELKPEHYYELNGQRLPMGVHAWEKYNPTFWRMHLPPWPEG